MHDHKPMILELSDGTRFEVELALVQQDAPELEPITDEYLDQFFGKREQR